eukprot:g81101.t1
MARLKWYWVLFGAFLAGTINQLCFFPYPYEHVVPAIIAKERLDALSPFPAQLTGAFEPNTKLLQAHRFFTGPSLLGPESVAVLRNGSLLLLDREGYVQWGHPQGKDNYQFNPRPKVCPPSTPDCRPAPYIGPGRPLGYHIVQETEAKVVVVVCDSLKGLVQAAFDSNTGDLQEFKVLSNRETKSGRPINYANDLDLSRDHQSVFFSSSTQHSVAFSGLGFYDTMRSFLLNFFNGDNTGRLLRYDFASGTTELLVDEMWYANGVAEAHDGKSILVVETNLMRVMQYWLEGPKKGTSTVLVDKLPGFPDGISKSSDGNYWLCLVAPLSPAIKVASMPGKVRQLLARLMLQSPLSGWLSKNVVKKWGCVVKLSPAGKVLETLMDTKGEKVRTPSAAVEHQGKLFLGNLGEDGIYVYNL